MIPNCLAVQRVEKREFYCLLLAKFLCFAIEWRNRIFFPVGLEDDHSYSGRIQSAHNLTSFRQLGPPMKIVGLFLHFLIRKYAQITNAPTTPQYRDSDMPVLLIYFFPFIKAEGLVTVRGYRAISSASGLGRPLIRSH